MKQIIFLIDIDNAKFLIEDINGKYRLPMLKGSDGIENISNEFFKKYKIKISKSKLEILKDNKKYTLIRTYINKSENDKKYKSYKLSDISQMICDNDENQREILTDIMINILKESINDSFWLGIILSVEDKIEDPQMKNMLTSFLLFFSSIFCQECVEYKLGKIINSEINENSRLKKMRNFYLKQCPLYNSKKIKKTIKEMGIDFNNYIFDIVLWFIDENLIDINIRNWNINKSNNYDIYNQIILSPRRWIKNQFPQYNDWFESIRKVYIDEFIKRFNKIKIIQKSYSTNKLFNKNLSDDEKVYILYRIGLLKTIKLISEIFGTGNFVGEKFNNNFYLDFDIFLIKVKATLIQMLWNDSQQNNLPFLNKILNNLPKELDDNFFTINRKCRDNIHYGFFNNIKKEDYKLLQKNQDIYLKYVIKEFNNNITYDFGNKYKEDIKIANILYKNKQ